MSAYKRVESGKDLGQIYKCLNEEHNRFCDTDNREGKEDALRLMKGHCKDYLNLAPQTKKFDIDQIERVLTKTITQRKECFEAREAGEAFEHLAKYAHNLLEQPWRKEYKTMLLYNGYFIHNIQAHLDDAHEILIAMGYVHIDDETLTLAGSPDLARLRDVSRNCFLASQECEILGRIGDHVNSRTKVEVLPHQIHYYRCHHVGDVSTIGTRIIYDVNQRQHEMKQARLSRSTGQQRADDFIPTVINADSVDGSLSREVPEREIVEKILQNTHLVYRDENIYDPVCGEGFKVSSNEQNGDGFRDGQSNGNVPRSNRSGRRSELPCPNKSDGLVNGVGAGSRQRRNSVNSIASSSGASGINDKHLHREKVSRESLGLPSSGSLNPSIASNTSKVSPAYISSSSQPTGSMDDMVAEAESYKFNFSSKQQKKLGDASRLNSNSSSRSPEGSISSDTSSWDYLSVRKNTQEVDQVSRSEHTLAAKPPLENNSKYVFETSLDDMINQPCENNSGYMLHETVEKQPVGSKKTADSPSSTLGLTSHKREKSSASPIMSFGSAVPKWKCPHCTYVNACEGNICTVCSKSKDFQFEPANDEAIIQIPQLSSSPRPARLTRPISPSSSLQETEILHLRSDSLSLLSRNCPYCTYENQCNAIMCEMCGSRMKPDSNQ